MHIFCIFFLKFVIQPSTNIQKIPVHTIIGDKMLITIIRTVLLYLFIILSVRIMGKRQLSDMQTSELVITLVISDIAAIPMQNTEQPLLSGMIPILILVSLEIIISVIMLKNRKFRKIICGNPVVIINNGKILKDALRKLRISYEDLYSLLRQQEIFDIKDVRFAIVETNGSISIQKTEEA